MAEDRSQRTEEATPRRRQKARDEGQVASSRELTAALQFGAGVLLLALGGAEVIAGLARLLRGTAQLAFRGRFGPAELEALIRELAAGPLQFLAVFAAALLTVGLVSHLSQTSFALTPKRLQPDFQRLNPLKRLQQLPQENMGQTFKALLFLPAAGFLFWYVIQERLMTFMALPRAGFEAGALTVGRTLLDLLFKASLLLIALGAYDYWRQRSKLRKRLRMTKHEVRQEHKELEGDPQIKARLRRLQRDLARRRMMSDLPKATVVVTNPTHYAVALRYDPDQSGAPVVIAKGLDHLAKRIREEADRYQIPIVENQPLAQALYKGAEVGQEIPVELFRAVAEVLAYIFRLRGQGPRR